MRKMSKSLQALKIFFFYGGGHEEVEDGTQVPSVCS